MAPALFGLELTRGLFFQPFTSADAFVCVWGRFPHMGVQTVSPLGRCKVGLPLPLCPPVYHSTATGHWAFPASLGTLQLWV